MLLGLQARSISHCFVFLPCLLVRIFPDHGTQNHNLLASLCVPCCRVQLSQITTLWAKKACHASSPLYILHIKLEVRLPCIIDHNPWTLPLSGCKFGSKRPVFHKHAPVPPLPWRGAPMRCKRQTVAPLCWAHMSLQNVWGIWRWVKTNGLLFLG